MIFASFLLCFSPVICHRLEHTLDILVLRLIELLQLPSFVRIAIELDRPAAVALPRGVRCDILNLALVFVRCGELIWVVFARISWRPLVFEVAHRT